MPTIYQQIEARFGFQLPALYREMMERGLFDSKEDRHVGDGILYSPEQIRDYEFYGREKPGLVPLGEDWGSNNFCWHLDEASEEGIPIALCYLDCGFAWRYAPDFRTFLYRSTLQNNTWLYDVPSHPSYNRAGKELWVRSNLRRWASVFEPYFPPHWTQTLRELAEREVVECEDGEWRELGLIDENESKQIVIRDLGYERLDEKFGCDADSENPYPK